MGKKNIFLAPCILVKSFVTTLVNSIGPTRLDRLTHEATKTHGNIQRVIRIHVGGSWEFKPLSKKMPKFLEVNVDITMGTSSGSVNIFAC